MSIKGYILTALKAEKLLIFFTLLYFTLVIRTIVSTNLTKINYFYERIKAKSSLMEIVFFVVFFLNGTAHDPNDCTHRTCQTWQWYFYGSCALEFTSGFIADNELRRYTRGCLCLTLSHTSTFQHSVGYQYVNIF